MGDPIEVQAIGSAFDKVRETPLLLGSVKTNIGHLEAAAGIAGLIKVILSLYHEAIPPLVNLEELNPNINFDRIPAKVPQELLTWKRNPRPRIAGVSSFGISGTNAHVVVEEAPLRERQVDSIDRPAHLLTLSAMSEKGLDTLVNAYLAHINQHPEESLADMAYTANTGRASFDYRLAVVASSIEELQNKLRNKEFKKGQIPESTPKIAFVLKGERLPSPDLGKQLYDCYPVFRNAIDHCTKINRSTESALFAFEYALYELWKSWGILPDFVIGDRTGELVAATVSGKMSLEEGLKNSAARKDLNELEPLRNRIKRIKEQGCEVFLEIGPEATDLLDQLSTLYLKGFPLDWKAFDAPFHRQKVSLPTYPFQRQRFWAKALDRE